MLSPCHQTSLVRDGGVEVLADGRADGALVLRVHPILPAQPQGGEAVEPHLPKRGKTGFRGAPPTCLRSSLAAGRQASWKGGKVVLKQ